jgi:hypothetical protein
MWVFTTGGFTSAVEHRDDDTMTMVRGRDKKSLEEMLSSMKAALVEGGKSEEEITDFMKNMEIYAVPGDYKWRVIVPKSAYALYLVYEAMHYVNYSNFKSKLTATRGDKWHDAAMSVWSAMFKITDTGKTGNPDVDNPKPYSYYHDGGSDSWGPNSWKTYPASPKGSGVSSSLSALNAKANQTADEDDTEHGLIEEYYSEGYKSTKYGQGEAGYNWSGGNGTQRYWGDDIGLSPMFEEDLEGYDSTVPSGTGGYHSFSGSRLNKADIDYIDGRAEIRDGEFVGSTFLEAPFDGPSDRELEQLALTEDEAWERWDEETEFNYITGETRSLIVDPEVLVDLGEKFDGTLSGRKSVMSMTDAEYAAFESEM